ncbi:PLDc_N domain-containing protein [Leucobacter weissii]|uniref:PLDc_N domain-containing protein n=1 Tax=Leucobacter weissii TaxID=1983706 RepID=A0A939MIS5_9MICO|nr:PLD nuclease N-terminal domain-containing protein [Leucobacter weissii]MBO1901010.1 PLDc_N domain-containing protein [Leucobacter weissii]
MDAPIDPLAPTAYDVSFTIFAAIAAVLLVVALVSIARHAQRLTAWQAILWVLLALVIPVLGPLAWLFIGRRAGAPLRSLPHPS